MIYLPFGSCVFGDDWGFSAVAKWKSGALQNARASYLLVFPCSIADLTDIREHSTGTSTYGNKGSRSAHQGPPYVLTSPNLVVNRTSDRWCLCTPQGAISSLFGSHNSRAAPFHTSTKTAGHCTSLDTSLELKPCLAAEGYDSVEGGGNQSPMEGLDNVNVLSNLSYIKPQNVLNLITNFNKFTKSAIMASVKNTS